MTQSNDIIEQQRDKLVSAYRALPESEQRVVQVMSIAYEPLNQTTILEILNHLKLYKPSLTAAQFKSLSVKFLHYAVTVPNKTGGVQCNPLLIEVATRDAVKAGWFERMVAALEAVAPLEPRWKGGRPIPKDVPQMIRQVRLGIYRGNLEFAQEQLDGFYTSNYSTQRRSLEGILDEVAHNPFDLDWVTTLPADLYEELLSDELAIAVQKLRPAEEAFEGLREACSNSQTGGADRPPVPGFLRGVLMEQLVLRGEWPAARQFLEQLLNSTAKKVPAEASYAMGLIAFVEGDYDSAIVALTTGLAAYRKLVGKRSAFWPGLGGLFLVLALLKEGGAGLAQALAYASGQANPPARAVVLPGDLDLTQAYRVLDGLVQLQMGDCNYRSTTTRRALHLMDSEQSLDILVGAWVMSWLAPDKVESELKQPLRRLCIQAEEAGYQWLAMEAAAMLTQCQRGEDYAAVVQTWEQTHNVKTQANLLEAKADWELALAALASIQGDAATHPATPTVAVDKRMAWLLTYFPKTGIQISVREQAVNAQGAWSKGRPIALKRLLQEQATFPYMTNQDRLVCSHIEASNSHGYYSKTDYVFGERAIVALVNHPFVFWEDSPTTRVEVMKGEPELLVKKGKGDRLVLELSPPVKTDESLVILKESPTRLKVIELNTEHHRVAAILGAKNRLEVPGSAQEKVLAAIGAIANLVTIQSDIGGGVTAEEVPSESKPHVHLLPAGTGLKIAVLVRPFGTGGSYYQPGKGGETVIAEIEGKRLQTTRNLKLEKQQAQAAIAACEPLQRAETTDGEAILDDPEDCLELLLALQELGETIVLEWPEGEKLRVSRQAGLSDFKMAIRGQRDWFEVSGELRVNNNLVLDMQQLMHLLEQSPGRFVQLENGQFLALTQEFRKRLDELRNFSDRSGKGVRLHPLAATAMEDWLDEVGQLKADKRWQEHLKRLQAAQDLQPVLPSTLQAELRDYQVAGFEWLARLAHWGVGACLADDMGLGKTLQALAVILTRAAQGPTLIVAPTSVCMNWLSEAERFAPTLNPLQFGSGDRQKLLDGLQPFDLLICSYGLLQQEDLADRLAQVVWQTIVLDEAQSIKNFATKRSQAAMALQGEFKILTTGTPIENHLGELWNLFRFINPGLLGSLDSFNQRFASPIERYGDAAARQRLKKLIQPFILRRTKSQVLDELPSRTEILLQVDLSPEEVAFYEVLRRSAIDRLANSDANAGQRHLQVLAEIMKLRRACCHARLVQSDTPLSSSKLNLFGEVLTELLDNHHKALVFSQFVDHLTILREYLDENKINYQYLDGSTPAGDRKKRVDAFQSGDGDVFLISLKAGGTGLNLTAADYVIHMDPWWNPAVEDQASDRAHRMGQQRPVTIYRLVAKGTIEEKIVQLHQHKRDLADSLLEGSDMSGKISTDDLLRLIQEG